MGIRGLRRYLRETKILPTNQIIVPNSKLLIDASGFLFFVQTNAKNACEDSTIYDEEISTNNETNGFEYLHGGDYITLDQLIVQEVEYLRSLDMILVFYFDGASRMKEEILAKRKEERRESWAKLFRLCQDHGGKKDDSAEALLKELNQNELPMPPLSMIQLKRTLSAFTSKNSPKFDKNVQIIYCDDEADQEMAKAASRGNTGLDREEEKYFVYANDSDFFAYKSTPYIEFGSIIPPKDIPYSRAPVWRRSDVASALNLSESLFVEFCLFIGNDYLSENFRLKLKSLENISLRYSVQVLGDMLNIVRSNESTFKLSSDDPNVLRSLNFSRDLYDLEDISQYPQDVDDEARVMALTSEEKDSLRDFMDTVLSYDPSTSKSSVFNDVINVLEILSNNPSFVSYYNILTRRHLDVIKKMFSDLESGSIDLIQRLDSYIPPLIDCLASHCFQLTWSDIIKKYSTLSPAIESLHPKDIFHGPYFHFLLHEQALKEEAEREMTRGSRPFYGRKVSMPKAWSQPPVIEATRERLPIDNHRHRILEKIARDRVVIIHGETGCGKSSRLPVIIYEDALEKNIPVKMMISQPRRIAADSLMKRVRSQLGENVGLRMGHGVKDESYNTKLFFVTTGYLVRLLAHHPETFDSHTHLIIDEVHERSIDSDVLCFLARQLLISHPTIRIILMSATIHTDLYQQYFSIHSPMSDSRLMKSVGDLECLSVGVRRFPIEIKFLDDLLNMAMNERVFPPNAPSTINKLMGILNNTRDQDGQISPKVSELQYVLVEMIIKSTVKLGPFVILLSYYVSVTH